MDELTAFVEGYTAARGNTWGLWEAAAKRFGGHKEQLRSQYRRSDTPTPQRHPLTHELPEETEITIEGYGNALIIGDTHEPFCLESYIDFNQRVRDKYKCDMVFHIGDLVDNHASSYHESDPDGMSAGDEALRALERLHKWYEAFPRVIGFFGNHDAIPARKGASGGLSRRFIKSFHEAWEMPQGWRWVAQARWGDTIIRHNAGSGGKLPAQNAAQVTMCNVVAGHHHSAAGVGVVFGEDKWRWGLNVGCGLDRKSYAAAYGKYGKPPALGCGVIYGGDPIFVGMN